MVMVVRGGGSFVRCGRSEIARGLIFRFILFFVFFLAVTVAVEKLSRFSPALALAEKDEFEKGLPTS